jgi:hypothetical protein
MLHPPARKRTLLREVNERIRDLNAASGMTSSYEILCECAAVDCARRVVVPGRVYDEAVAHGHGFLVTPDHAGLERIVDYGPTYAVVA